MAGWQDEPCKIGLPVDGKELSEQGETEEANKANKSAAVWWDAIAALSFTTVRHGAGWEGVGSLEGADWLAGGGRRRLR